MAEDPEIPNNQPDQAGQPGGVVTPGAASPPPDPAPTPAQTPPGPGPAPEQDPEQRPGLPAASSTTPGTVTWTASEFIAHDKSVGWYLGLAIGTIAFSVLIFLVTRDVVSVVVIVVAAIVFGAYGARQPRQLQYAIDQAGVTIGAKRYTYDQFKSFSVVPEGGFSSISFMPLKRLSPITTIYYAPEDENKIMAVLSGCLPYQEPRRDLVDNLMRRIRF